MLEIFVICLCAAQTRDFWQKAFTSSTHRRQNNLYSKHTISDRVGSPGQRVKGADPVPCLPPAHVRDTIDPVN